MSIERGAMKRKPKSKAAILAELEYAKMSKDIIVGTRVSMMVSICILWDKFGFDADEVVDFVAAHEEFLESYSAGKEDLTAIIDNIKAEIGIDMLTMEME